MPKVKSSDFGFITFETNQLQEIVRSLNMDFNPRGYLTRDNETVICYSCKKAMRKDRIGHILPGSEIVCCDSPLCFASYANDYLED